MLIASKVIDEDLPNAYLRELLCDCLLEIILVIEIAIMLYIVCRREVYYDRIKLVML